MAMTDRILVATDGSEMGARAVACAAELSDKLHRGLSIVHVQLHTRPSIELTRLAENEHLLDHLSHQDQFAGRPPAGSLGAFYELTQGEVERAWVIEAIGTEILARATTSAELAGARDIRSRAAAGDYADEILDMAEAEGATMIVLGRRGLGRLREVLLGSVTQKVLHATDRTVVIVR
jgi:nucleotide-binding universal stress UspA family protein